MNDTKASLILHNARVLSPSLARPHTSLVAVRDGLITWVGTEADLAMLRGPVTTVIDCQGGSVIPGFIDAHMHLFAYAASLLAVDCSPHAVASISDVLNALRLRASQLPPGTWVRGWGIEEYHLAEGRLPVRLELDAAVPGHPVKLVHRSGHACILNSAALRAMDISEKTPEPPGAMMERDIATGDLTGYLLEMEDELERRGSTSLTKGDLENGLTLAEQRLLSVGITTIHDATPSRALARWDLLQALKGSGGFRPRVHNMFGIEDLPALQERGLSFCSGDDSLRVGPAKIMLNETGSDVLPPLQELAGMVYEALSRGFQVAFHAVEEAAMDAAITAIGLATKRLARRGAHPADESANRPPSPAFGGEGAEGERRGMPPTRALRHRIEHGGLCPYPLRQRMAGLGMMLVTQPAFVREHGDRYSAKMPDKTDALYPIASYRRDGVEVAFGSDCPVVPPDPFIGIAGASTRLTRTGAPFGPQERATPIEALSMYTRAGAYASFDEWRKGRILPGFLADLVVLDRNPWTAPADSLEGIRALRTIIGGEVVWERG